MAALACNEVRGEAAAEAAMVFAVAMELVKLVIMVVRELL